MEGDSRIHIFDENHNHITDKTGISGKKKRFQKRIRRQAITNLWIARGYDKWQEKHAPTAMIERATGPQGYPGAVPVEAFVKGGNGDTGDVSLVLIYHPGTRYWNDHDATRTAMVVVVVVVVVVVAEEQDRDKPPRFYPLYR